MPYDLLILGRGIAGAVLAEAARRRGLSVHVFDHKQVGNATMAAGGAVNPVVLRRNTLCWRAAELMPLVHAFFSAWDQHMGIRTWHKGTVVKLFSAAKEQEQWNLAMDRLEMASFLANDAEPEIDHGSILAPYGHGTVTNAGWLDIPALLDVQREMLLKGASLTERMVAEEEIHVQCDGVRIGDVQARWLVRCAGPFPPTHGLSLVKGETLTVRIPNLHLSRIVYGGIGLLPVGANLFRVGSTFKWTNVWEGPTEQAKDWMLARVREMVDLPVEWMESHAGVRPAARDRKPIVGKTGPHQAVINGLGARGVMQAPWCAEHLLNHLFNGTPLDQEVDAARFFR